LKLSLILVPSMRHSPLGAQHSVSRAFILIPFFTDEVSLYTSSDSFKSSATMFLRLTKQFISPFFAFFLTLCISGQLTVYIMIKRHLVLPNTDDHINEGDSTTTNAEAAEPSSNHIQQNCPMISHGRCHHPTDITPKMLSLQKKQLRH